MMLSAIIPTQGLRPQMLARAVASVKAQLPQAAELVLVADATQQQADAIWERFLDAQIQCTGGGRGVSAARNLGAKHARGEYLAFLDDDDVWKSGYFARVFENEEPFDVALSAFEKHRPEDIAPEKIPPKELCAATFLVKNPGLRGSNLVIRREVYLELGGFDEDFPAFNDMDFGVRLCDAGPWRYRRIVEHLVEFHSHRGARLSCAGSQANRAGLQRFWTRYKDRMDLEQRAAFCARAVKLWGIDPRAL